MCAVVVCVCVCAVVVCVGKQGGELGGKCVRRL